MTDKEGILQKFIELNKRYYCPYCGKELKEYKYNNNARYWEDDSYRVCDCKDAKKECEIMSQIKKLESQLPAVKYEIKPQLTKIK